MKPKTDLQVLESAILELDGIWSDSVQYPQLKMHEQQEERVKNLLFDLREHVNRNPFRRRRP